MRGIAAGLVPTLVVVIALAVAERASSEPFLDLYGGVSATASTRVTAGSRDCVGAALFFVACQEETKATRNVDFDPSATFGLRGGYWFDAAPWAGVAADLSFFEAQGGDTRFRIVPLSVLGMLRLPILATDELPGGRLQPYVGAGFSFVILDSTADFRPELARRVSGGPVGYGLDARLGLAWQFHRHVAVFTEYRFTYVPMDESDSSARERLDASLKTHHLLGGVSFRF